MSDHAAVLVPDNDDLVLLFHQALDLLQHLEACEQDVSPDDEPWAFPPPIANSVALAALGRIADVLRHVVGSFRDADHPPGQRLYAPDGRWEHCALRLVTVDPRDLALLAQVSEVLARAALRARNEDMDPIAPRALSDVVEALDAFTPDQNPRAWPGTDTVTAAEAVAPLLRLFKLLSVAPDNFTTIVEAIQTDPAADRIVLTHQQEREYQRVADALNAAITGGSPLSRYLY